MGVSLMRPTSNGVPSDWLAYHGRPDKYAEVNQSVSYPDTPEYSQFGIYTLTPGAEQVLNFGTIPEDARITAVSAYLWISYLVPQEGPQTLLLRLLVAGEARSEAAVAVTAELCYVIVEMANLDIAKCAEDEIGLSLIADLREGQSDEIDLSLVYLLISHSAVRARRGYGARSRSASRTSGGARQGLGTRTPYGER